MNKALQAAVSVWQGYIPENVVQIKIVQIEHRITIQNRVFPGG